MVIHSLTKYIGGHSDVVMGCICLNDKELYDRLFFAIKCKYHSCSFINSYWIRSFSFRLLLSFERIKDSCLENGESHDKRSNYC